jgi:hypothetical protein
MEVFHSNEWDTILNSLLNLLPCDSPFNLYEISQQEKIEYSDFLTSGFAKNENTYVEITNYLIYNDFAKLFNFEKIILTDKGKKLVEYRSYKKFMAVFNLKTKAEIRDLWVKKNWFWVEFVKIIVGLFMGILLTLCIQNL